MPSGSIRTTHTGSLPRSTELTDALLAQEAGRAPADLDRRTEDAVTALVARQSAIGLDVVDDGEQGKASYATYVHHRLNGFEGEAAPAISGGADPYPDLTEQLRAARPASAPAPMLPACVGPVTRKADGAVERDIAVLKAAAAAAGHPEDGLFMTAASPGLIAGLVADRHYGDPDAYMAAIIAAMRPEYEAIVAAGITLQLDCPDLAATYVYRAEPTTVPAYRREIARNVEALNTAVAGLPAERMRFHVCWGNQEHPHTGDIPLRDILDILLTAAPAGLVLEAANPRHAHEWQIFEDVDLPDDRYLVAGVIDSTTNFVEHPDLIAQRLANFVRLLGTERVVAGSDCGFATWAGPRRVAPSVVWAKLEALVEGARRVRA